MNFKMLVKGLIILLVCVAASVLLWVTSELLGIYWIYGLFLNKVISIFGLDITFSRMTAALLTVLTLLILPWVISFLFLGKRKVELLIASVILIIGGTFAIYYGSADVFFDRETGKPAKYFIKTLDGFKFSNLSDYDPKFGIKYKPITLEVVKEFHFWEKTGKMQNVPKVPRGKYFDQITGEPIVWYAERSEKTIRLFPLPGYDPLTGEVLKPITADIVKQKIPEEPKETSPSESALADYLVAVCKQGGVQSASSFFLDWYLNFQGGEVRSKHITIEQRYSGFLGGPSVTYRHYDISVEKIIFEEPYTIIGMAFKAINDSEVDVDGSIIDCRGVSYQPIVILASGKIDRISGGEVKRIILIIKHTDPESLNSGSFSYRATGMATSQIVSFTKE